MLWSFSSPSKFCLSLESQMASRPLFVVMSCTVSSRAFTISIMLRSSSSNVSLLSFGSWISSRGLMRLSSRSYAAFISSRLARACSSRYSFSLSPLSGSFTNGLMVMPSFIISSLITCSRETVTIASGMVIGVAEMRISTLGLMFFNTFSDCLAARPPNMCSSSMITMMGRPYSSWVRRVRSYREAELSVSRTMMFLSLLMLSQFTKNTSPGWM